MSKEASEIYVGTCLGVLGEGEEDYGKYHLG
jgi:hypothetical protein